MKYFGLAITDKTISMANATRHKVEKNQKIIIANNNNNITNIQKNNSKEEKINLNSDSVNSNNFMRDLNLQRIKE